MTALLMTAGAAPAGADPERHEEHGGTQAWLNLNSATDAAGQTTYSDFQLELKPPVGFRHAYTKHAGPFYPGDEATGAAGFFSFVDLGIVEPAEQTPEVVLVYRKADDRGRMRTHVELQSFYRNVETGEQCFGATHRTFAGPVTWIATPEGRRSALVAADPALTDAFGGSGAAAPAVAERISGQPQSVETEGVPAADIQASPELRAAIEAHAASARSAYEQQGAGTAGALVEKRARFAGWLADLVTLGRSAEAAEALRTQAGALRLAEAPEVRIALEAVRDRWAESPTDMYRSIERALERKPRTLRVTSRFDLSVLRRAGRARARIDLAHSDLVGREATVTFRKRKRRGGFSTLRRRVELSDGLVLEGPRVKRRDYVIVEVAVAGFAADPVSYTAGSETRRLLPGSSRSS